jgi:hypothetical protein
MGDWGAAFQPVEHDPLWRAHRRDAMVTLADGVMMLNTGWPIEACYLAELVVCL